MKPLQVSPKLAVSLVATNLLVLAGTIAAPAWSSRSRANHFTTLTAERIDIVDADGRTVIAISNKARVAGPVVAGKRYPPGIADGREHLAGLVFFNQEGDEMGGLLFNSFRQPNGRVAGMGHLSFDRYGDNQVISLEHNENAAGVRSGIRFYDRPGTGAFKTSLDLVEEAQDAAAPRRARIGEELAGMRRSGALGAERAFLGSANGSSRLELKDSKGRTRVRAVVGDDDRPRLEFLDEDGGVEASYPQPATGSGAL